MSDLTKVCCRCNERKTIEEFGWKNKGLLIRLAACRACRAIETKAQYDANKEKRKKDASARRLLVREANAEKLYDYLLDHPCVECGEGDPLVLEFHHEGPEKNFNVGEMLSTRLVDFNSDKIQFEISLCVILCANCHKRHTHKERNSSKYQQKLKREGGLD